MNAQRRWMPLVMTALFVSVALFAPRLAPYDPLHTDPVNALQAPSSAHVFGTDILGRDVFSRVLHGATRTLLMAGGATALALVVGTALGIAATARGFGRGIDLLLTALLAIPGLVIALVAVTLSGAGETALAIAVGIAQIATCARVTRAAARAAGHTGYVEAARSLGARERGIAWRHILPNAAPTVLAYAAVIFTYAILNVAALAFLGLGGDLSSPEWGAMLAEGRQVFRTAPWVAFAPGAAITLAALLANALADRR